MCIYPDGKCRPDEAYLTPYSPNRRPISPTDVLSCESTPDPANRRPILLSDAFPLGRHGTFKYPDGKCGPDEEPPAGSAEALAGTLNPFCDTKVYVKRIKILEKDSKD